MTPRVKRELAHQLDLLARDLSSIKHFDRLRPHVFTEQKDELRSRARKLAAIVRASDTMCDRNAARSAAERVFGPSIS